MSESLGEPGPVYRVARRGMDPATKRLAMFAGGLGGVLLLILGVSSLKGHRETAVPVIQADNRPLRVKPDNPGGMQVAGANDEIMSGDAGPQADKLLPPPEVPLPQSLKPKMAEPTAPSHAAATAVPATAESVSLPPPAAAPEQKPVAPAKAVSSAPPQPSFGKATQVQLAAMDSEQLAMTEWQRLSRRMPDVLGGRQPAVLKAEHDGRTIWRLRTGGFSDIAQATAFCERVRSKGGGCSIASF